MKDIKLVYNEDLAEIFVGNEIIRLWGDECTSEHLEKVAQLLNLLGVKFTEVDNSL